LDPILSQFNLVHIHTNSVRSIVILSENLCWVSQDFAYLRITMLNAFFNSPMRAICSTTLILLDFISNNTWYRLLILIIMQKKISCVENVHIHCSKTNTHYSLAGYFIILKQEHFVSDFCSFEKVLVERFSTLKAETEEYP
jgi:hypothetical protein